MQTALTFVAILTMAMLLLCGTRPAFILLAVLAVVSAVCYIVVSYILRKRADEKDTKDAVLQKKIANWRKARRRQLRSNADSDDMFDACGITQGMYYIVVPKYIPRRAIRYVITILQSAVEGKFGYSDCFIGSSMDDLSIKLPSTPDGAPDWTYMESYMANLEAKVAESLTLLQAAKNAEKKKVDTREWGSFALGTLFNIVKGKRLTKAEMKSGETPFIGSSALNNGCTAMIGNDKNQHPENTITVCYNGSVGETFYQDQPYIASDDVNVLYPKFTMNRQIALFIVPLIKGVSSRYDYIDKWKKEAMEADKIYLPVDKNGQPDWAYMEEYMRKVEERVKVTMEKYEMTVNEVAL